MKTLCMDTSTNFLVIGLIENHQVIDSYQVAVPKKQSEFIFPELIRLFDRNDWSVDQLDQVIVSEGPGSYTGVRIAMTIAKVLCSQKDIPLFTISSFLMLAGEKTGTVLIDAKGKKVFVCPVSNGKLLEAPSLLSLDELNLSQEYIGDIHLIGKDYVEIDYLNNILALEQVWQKVENVHAFVPTYIKGV